MNHRPRSRAIVVLALTASLGLGACSGASVADQASKTAQSSEVGQGNSAAGSASPVATSAAAGSVFDDSSIHEFSVEVDQAEYEAMIATYLDNGDKDWISGTVTIDGQVFENVGLKLKGNSSLRGVSADSDPTALPWRIRLDKYVDDQNLDGYSDFVVRANNSETSLNEALALDLLEAAGLASEHAVAASFSVNGSEADLRLVVQNLDDTWDEENFGDEGILYKADAEGDYSYRGTDATAYTEAFDVEAGEDDYQPLIEFLDFVNNSTDEEFAEELSDRLDVEEFARYLAFEDLVSNMDDISGPGNNSYLRWDAATGVMTVVAWDHNLAFGGMGGPGMGGGMGDRGMGGFPGGDGEMPEGFPGGDGEMPEGFTPPGDGEMPEGFTPPGDGEMPEGGPTPGQGMGGRGGNVLAERFQDNEEFAALYDDALADLEAELIDSGLAQQVLDGWVDLLTNEGGELIDAETVESEAEQIVGVLSGEVSPQEMPGRRPDSELNEGNDSASSTSTT